MSMVVRTNSMAMNANSALNKNNSSVAGNLQKLSTGFRINRAADDASGLAVSEKMKAQIKALDQAGKNAQDGASLIKTAEGYMGEIHDMLNRIVELAEKSANGTFETVDGGATAEAYGSAATDRQAIQDEVDQLTTEIDRIATTANFNQLKLLDGSLSTKYSTPYTQDQLDAGTYFVEKGDGTYESASLTNSEGKSLYTLKTAEVPHEDAVPATDVRSFYVASGNTFVKTEDEVATGETVYYDLEGLEGTKPAADADLTGDNYIKTGSEGNWTFTKTDATKADGTTTYYKIGDSQKAETTTGKAEVQFQAAVYEKANIEPGGEETKTGTGLTLQIGETSSSSDKLEVSIDSFKTADLFADISTVTTSNKSEAYKTASADGKMSGGLTINVSNQQTASEAAEKVRDVINKVSAQRATLGAMENRLDYTMNNLDTASQNITDANSRIRDTDMAKTMMQYTQGNTLTQAAQAMLAQANQAPSQVLQLLQ